MRFSASGKGEKGWKHMQTVWQDIRYGVRGFAKQPAFAALAVLTLALGVGAATTIFSVIHNVLFDPFPYKDSDRVVTFQIRDTASGRAAATFFRSPSSSTTRSRATSSRT